MNRRDLLKVALAGATATALPFETRAFAANPRVMLRVGTRTIDVNGRAATVYALVGSDGKTVSGFEAGTDFDVIVRNDLAEDTMIHWHGLTPPWPMDGVPGAPTVILKNGEERAYRFPIGGGGTHWMHAHTLQEQNLLAAPLIVEVPGTKRMDEQEVVVMLHDFSFIPATELLANLQKAGAIKTGDGMAMDRPDLNDIDYDAYLANDRTLDDPEVVQVDRNGTVRLRIINGATATTFTIDLGTIDGSLIAVDGQAIVPVSGRRFAISMGQRVDIRLRVPALGGSFPILALREGAPERTGLVLATAGAKTVRIASTGEPVMYRDIESSLRAALPLGERAPDQTFAIDLAGDMAGYRWSMPGADNIRVRKGERIEITMRNLSMMAHPMHLHGHHFQVVAVDGKRFPGAVRDTVQVLPKGSVTIAMDAGNPGRWAFHCHHLYHMATGMMAEFAYEGVA